MGTRRDCTCCARVSDGCRTGSSCSHSSTHVQKYAMTTGHGCAAAAQPTQHTGPRRQQEWKLGPALLAHSWIVAPGEQRRATVRNVHGAVVTTCSKDSRRARFQAAPPPLARREQDEAAGAARARVRRCARRVLFEVSRHRQAPVQQQQQEQPRPIPLYKQATALLQAPSSYSSSSSSSSLDSRRLPPRGCASPPPPSPPPPRSTSNDVCVRARQATTACCCASSSLESSCRSLSLRECAFATFSLGAYWKVVGAPPRQSPFKSRRQQHARKQARNSRATRELAARRAAAAARWHARTARGNGAFRHFFQLLSSCRHCHVVVQSRQAGPAPGRRIVTVNAVQPRGGGPGGGCSVELSRWATQPPRDTHSRSGTTHTTFGTHCHADWHAVSVT